MEIPGCALPGDGTSRSPLAQLWLELGKLLGVAVELTCGYSPGYQPPSLGKQLGYNFHNYACINPLSSQDLHFEVRQLEEVKEQMGTLRPCEALKTQEDSRMRPAQYTVYMFRYVHDQMCTHMILYIYIYIYIYIYNAPLDRFRSRSRFKNIRLCSLPLPCAGSTRHATWQYCFPRGCLERRNPNRRNPEIVQYPPTN